MIAGGRVGDRALDRVEIAERHLIEAFDDRAEAFEIFFLSAGRERRERAAVEGAFECDDADAFRMSADRVIFARHLDRAFHRLGAGIAEEHGVREARRAQPLARAARLAECGKGSRRARASAPARSARRRAADAHGQARSPPRRRRNRDSAAVGRRQPSAFAPLEGEVGTRIGRQKMRSHGQCPV